ncbi:LytR/AlgR family response regulator transcription factor [Facklamia miroungae]|uniref:LytTr DNA-binding domain-containing protein n=1 Tax=Facklamia miroungae TaxID=120956 RepID=A0A1G7UVV6_9LACT|nr:LytTR family DNA-binding domain-containing protein [Facklamia miroungae]NKZ30143.1 hypothetical protein [Facklamia miroungae]SDG51663.1 LytTr DNA-binding domain-containing protein [Facklamia miroungae]
MEGYQVDALDFLLKPINASAIERVLSKYLLIQPKFESFLIVEDHMGKQHVLELDDLILVEVNKRELRLVLADQDLLIPGTLARFKESLDQRFVAPHRSYLVNLNHVESMGKEEVILSSGVKVPLSRRSAKSIQKAFIDHYKGSAFYD